MWLGNSTLSILVPNEESKENFLRFDPKTARNMALCGHILKLIRESLHEQSKIIEESILGHIDGIECWHSRNDSSTTNHYVRFAKKHGLVMTGGSDCHQKPILMGTVRVPEYVAGQFNFECTFSE